MTVPIVTVLMAVYNGEKCLKHTIESILNQTFKHFEFLIIDDCSTDRTIEVVKSYKDERIIIYKNENNIGQTKSLNRGLKLARGKYLARIDADDVSLPMRLERQVKYIEDNTKIILVGTAGFYYDDSGKVISIANMPDSMSAMKAMIFFASPILHVSVLMRREKICQLGGYNESYDILADYELWSRLIQNNFQMVNIKEVLVGYRISPNSYGSKNLYGKSNIETAKIIQGNVNKMTKLSITFDQAESINKLFNHNMGGMSLDEIESTEKLFANIFKCINASKCDVNWFLVKNYIKYVFKNLGKIDNKIKFRYAIRAIFSRGIYLFLSQRCLKSLLSLCQSIRWRSKKFFSLNFK